MTEDEINANILQDEHLSDDEMEHVSNKFLLTTKDTRPIGFLYETEFSITFI